MQSMLRGKQRSLVLTQRVMGSHLRFFFNMKRLTEKISLTQTGSLDWGVSRGRNQL